MPVKLADRQNIPDFLIDKMDKKDIFLQSIFTASPKEN